MDFVDFKLLINGLMEFYLPYKEGRDIKERWEPVVKSLNSSDISISLFNHTLMLIKFYANKIILWELDELEFAYKLIFDYIELCINENPNFIFNKFKAYTSYPKRIVSNRNKLYSETILKMREVINR